MEIHITVATGTDILNSVANHLQTTSLSHANTIAEGIYSLGESGSVELWIAILSLLISLVAVGVTLYTVHKQNRIALFNLRYDAFYAIFLVLQFAGSIEDLSKPKVALMLYNSYFGTSLPLEDRNTALQLVYAHNKKMEKVSFASKFLFKAPEAQQLIADMFIGLKGFMTSAIDEQIDVEARKQLCSAAASFYNNYMEIFEKPLHMYNYRKPKE